MAKNAGKPENLDPVRTKDEAKRRGHNGGVKSGEARRAKRDARAAALKLLNMNAKGKLRDNLVDIGYAKNDDEGILNIDVLVARLFIMSASGNLQAHDRLLKIAGYDTEENRLERESVNADRRKERESLARLEAMEAGKLGRYSSSYTDSDENDSVEDVFIYLPDNGRDQHLQKQIVMPDNETDGEDDTELSNTGDTRS